MSQHTTSTSTFTCAWCGSTMSAYAADGAPRGHCAACLRSRHDACGGRMAPIAVAVLRAGAWQIVHRCEHCDALTASPAREDDNQFVLMRMAVRPLAQPPFPFEAFGSR
ncbi:RNHCP domain-containing protein [Streptomyces sp. NPDC090025]|uniref:RNHCP domain-containing protein n=1 Tax=Streptomyces sp. NPDC090025 TaxID=3365922 RepID=UPI003838527B